MIALRPFFMLLGRASVFWVGLFTLAWLTLLVVGISEPDSRVTPYVSPLLVATLVFPGAAGWLFGLAIQEFQHTGFAAQLPAVRRKLLSGFLLAGVVVTAITLLFVRGLEPAPFGPALGFVLGIGSYAACGVLLDPLSTRVTVVSSIAALFVIARSRDLAQLAGEHAWIAAALALAIGAAGCGRLFARRTFRLKPSRPTNPLPGRFSLERADENERRRRLALRRSSAAWNPRHLGSRIWRWVKAAHYEVHGGLGLRAILRTAGKLWGLLLIVVLSAWIERGEMSFFRALGYSLYDAILRSPHVEAFGEDGGPKLMVAAVIAAAGIVTALFRPIELGTTLLYPLSRRQRAAVSFRSALADALLLLLIAGLGMLLLAQLIGLLIGFAPRIDYMPFHMRVLLVTLILMPLGHRGRLALLEASRRKEANTLLGVIFGCGAFVLLVGLGSFLVSSAALPPLLELGTLTAAWVATHLVYRGRLLAYYETADLA